MLANRNVVSACLATYARHSRSSRNPASPRNNSPISDCLDLKLNLTILASFTIPNIGQIYRSSEPTAFVPALPRDLDPKHGIFVPPTKEKAMFTRSRIIKLSISLLALGGVAIAGISADWNKVIAGLVSNSEIAATFQHNDHSALPLTIGSCDTAGPIEVEATAGTAGPTAYATLKDAFDAINAGTHQGSINVEVCGNTAETATASLNASGSGSALYTDITVRPVGGSRIIEGSITGAVIKLTGADNVTIDGRQGGTGNARDLTVRNNSSAAATAAIWLTSTGVGAGATNNTIRNLEISAGVDQQASTNSTFGINLGSNNTAISTSSGGDDLDNNSFIANRIVKARYGISTRGQTTNNALNTIITDNIIGPNSFGSDQIGKVGIYLQADTGAVVSRNTVQNVGVLVSNAAGGADRCGICVGSEGWSATASTTITSGDYTVTKNIIHDIIEEKTFSSVGLQLATTRGGSATNNLVANNFIYNVRANGTTGDQFEGIGIAGGNGDKVVFNSISLTGDVDPGAATTSTTWGGGIRIPGANGTNNANFVIQNNSIYLDVSSNTATQHYFAITLNAAAYTFGTGGLNFNNYYINGSNAQLRTGGLGTATTTGPGTEFATLANWQAALTTPQDANSIQADPLYISTTSDLHVFGASPNVNVGTSITGVTDDVDGQARPNGAAADIGADEFYALPGSLQLSSATYSGNEGATMSVTVNRTGGTSGAVSVDYTLANGTATGGASCSGSTDFVNPGTQTLNFGDGITSQSFNVTLCSDAATDPNETFTITLGNPTGGATVGSPSAATATITDVPPPFNGTINVGSGQTYTSLTNSGGLFEAINLGGANGNITIDLVSDLSGETGTVALNEVAGGFSVTIKPSGAARTITGNSSNSIIRLNGADNVTIDGSLTGGQATGVGGDASLRNLTIQNTNTAATAGAVIAVMQGPNSANDVTIKNVIISGQDPTQTLIGIHVGGNTIGAAPTVSSNNNVIIDNCAFKRSFIGIFNDGVSAAAAATGNKITHNDITATGPDRMRRAGIFFFNQNGIEVTDNAIGGIVADESADAIGIIAGVQNVNATATTSGGVYNAIIGENRISGISSTSTVGFSAVGIAIAGDPLAQNFIGNNMISGISAPSTSPDMVAGIFVAGVAGSNTHLFYNSVALTGDRGAVASQIGSYGVAISGTNPVVELKNNIFYNAQTSGGGANAKSYAIGMTTTTFTNLSSNYNDFVSTGANAAGFRTGSLDTTGTDLANLAAWQAATSGDSNSLAVDPLFVNTATDLHIQAGSPMINAGTFIAVINKDFDGQTRDAMPDIGADEFGLSADLAITKTDGVTTAVPGGSVTYTITASNAGPDIASGASVTDVFPAGLTATWTCVGAGGGTCTASGSGNISDTVNLPVGGSVTYTASAVISPAATGTISNTATITTPSGVGDPNTANNSATDTDTLSPQSDLAITKTDGVTTVNQGGSTTYTVTASNAGPSNASGATVADALPVEITAATWTCVGAGGGTCTASGSGNINDTVNLPSGASVTYTISATISGSATGTLVNTATVTAPGTVTDPTPGNNSATDTDTINGASAPVVVTATAGTTGPTNYNTLTAAIAAINNGTHQGAVVININQNTTEPGTIVINGSGAGPASYTSLLIRPTTTVTVSGASAQGRGLIELNGADNVTIDGDSPNSIGANTVNRDLTIQNTAANTTTFTSVIRIALATTVTNTADNDTVKNVNIKGSATGLNVAANTSTTGSANTTFGIFAGPGASTTDPTAAPAAVTSVTTGVAAGATAANLHFSNNRIVTAARGISLNGAATSVFTGTVVDNNVIGNATAGDADQVYAIGINASGGTGGVISGNTIWVEGFIASSASTHGIDIGVTSANTTGFAVDSNKVNRVRNNNGQTWAAYGINLGGGSTHIVQNNFVSGVINNQTAGTGAFGTTFGAYGIRISSGTGHKVYHNSVHLYDMLPGTTNTDLTAGFMITATTLTGIDVRNNIFSNQVVGGNPAGTRNVAVYLPAGATSAMNLTWNNNAYYVGTDALNRLAQVGTTFGTGEFQVADFDPTQTTPATNFRAYTSTLSVAGTNDNASFAVGSAPPFTSNTDLHIPAGTATRLESGGAAVGVAVDIDAETRNATTPDIGADEFVGQPPAANDIAATSFVVPANGSTIPTGSNFSPQAKFTNNGTATQTNVTVRFKIIDSMMATVYDQTAMIAMIDPLQSVTVTFPSTSVAAPGTYMMQASAELAGDTVPSNDTISGSFNAVSPIGGTVTVGSGGTYPSLTNPGGLFEALNLAGISSNLTVDITSDLTAETGAVPLNQLAEAGAGGYTVTIKPSGAARVISGTSAANSALIVLNGADRIVIDGSLSGGTDRSLTITNNQTSTTAVIWIRSPNASNGATNNTVKNCIINGAPGPNSTTTAGILTGSGTTLGNDAEAANSNNTIQNNWIYRVQNSMYLRGGVGAAQDQNWTVTGNELGSTNASDKNIFRGMLIGNSAGFTISGNVVHGIQSTGTTTASMSGIQLALVLNGGTVTNNMISDIKNVSGSGTGAAGVSIIATSTGSNVTIANNFISDIAATGSATVASNGHGMSFLGSGSGYNVYFNSVNLNTNQVSAQTTAAMFINSTFATAGAIDLRNNILANTETTGSRFAVYSLAASTVFSTINYNDYFAQNVGFIGGSTRVSLADWQAATTQDANSKAVDPLFVSATDLHLQVGSPLIAMGVAGTGITTDIDGDTRDNPPEIGADEIPAGSSPGSVQFSSATYSVGEAAGTVTLTFTRTGGSSGAISASFDTANGTATGGASCAPGIDYITVTGGMVTWASGDTASKTATVTICNDAVFEADESFTATIVGTTGGAVIGTPNPATITITNDDAEPIGTITVNDVRVLEGNTGGANAQFTVTYVGVNPASATVNYATSDGTAASGTDYVGVSGTISFGSGLGGTQTVSRTVSVPIIGKALKEENETFFLNLSSPVNATISDGQGVGIIVDDDRAYPADFDRDYYSDLSVFRPSEGNWYVFNSSNNEVSVVTFGLPTDRPVPGDYDGDGKTDVAVFREAEGNWYMIRSSDASIHVKHWGAVGDKPVQGDYDGDGLTDLAVYRPSTGQWWIDPSSNNATYTVTFGISTDRLVQGDYDGDFKTDQAVYRDGTWFILMSSTGGVVQQTFGIATDKPIVGDFDGDGKTDLTVYRDGLWWIFNSLTGTTGAVQWGVSTDILVPADYDRDGTTDFAVFRPSTGQWFVLRSSDGSYFALVFGQNGDVPIPSALLPQ
jgi:uncharacterized repeat protein (TIGR01451 family)